MLFQYSFRVLLAVAVVPLVFIFAVKARKQSKSFFVTTVPGMEKILANEIKELTGAASIQAGKNSVSFQGDVKTGLEAILWLRSPLRVMEKIAENKRITSKDKLYSWIRGISWSNVITTDQTLKCDTILGSSNCPELSHTHFTSLTVKNAVKDHFKDLSENGARPDVDLDNPDLPLLLYLHENQATLYRVWSGEASMHKRGYRSETVHKAALRESTAAGLLLFTEWHRSLKAGSDANVFCDPMCGSGTLPIEAALIAADTAPGLIRYKDFPTFYKNSEGNILKYLSEIEVYDKAQFSLACSVPCPLRWTDLAPLALDDWKAVWQDAVHRDQRKLFNKPELEEGSVEDTGDQIRKPTILANDVHPGSIQLSIEAAAAAGVHRMISFSCKDIAEYKPSVLPKTLVTNPPWDLRLLEGEESWSKLATFIKKMQRQMSADEDKEGGERRREFIGTDGIKLWTLTGNESLSRNLNFLKESMKKKFRAGNTELSFIKYFVDPI